MVDPYRFVCVSSHNSGLNTDIWLHSCEVGVKRKSKPHILVYHQNTWEKIYLVPDINTPHNLRVWLDENSQVLAKHWNGILTDKEVLNSLSNNKGDPK